MILLDFEIAIFLVTTCALGAQQALIESSDGDERCIEVQTLDGDLSLAFSGFCIWRISCTGVDSVLCDNAGDLLKFVAIFSIINSPKGPCTTGLVIVQRLSNPFLPCPQFARTKYYQRSCGRIEDNIRRKRSDFSDRACWHIICHIRKTLYRIGKTLRQRHK